MDTLIDLLQLTHKMQPITHYYYTEYELGAAASTSMANESLAVSEAEVETGVRDTEKKDLEPIPEKGGGEPGTTSSGGEEVIANPTTTSGEGSQDDKGEEEVTRM